jgi:hypothetical protein
VGPVRNLPAPRPFPSRVALDLPKELRFAAWSNIGSG